MSKACELECRHSEAAVGFHEILGEVTRNLGIVATGPWKAMVKAAGSYEAKPLYAVSTEVDRYVLKSYLPGATTAGTHVETSAHSLRITGRTQLRFSNGLNFGYVREQPVDEAFTLPPDADGEHADWSLESSGLLTIAIPRHTSVEISCPPSSSFPTQIPDPAQSRSE